MIGNEYILEGDIISEVVFNNYLKYLDNEYNKSGEYFIVSSDFEKIIHKEGKLLENEFNSITSPYMNIPKI